MIMTTWQGVVTVLMAVLGTVVTCLLYTSDAADD